MKKAKKKTVLQWIGLGLFVLALGIFTYSLTAGYYQLDAEVVIDNFQDSERGDYQRPFIVESLSGMSSKSYSTSFAFEDALLSAFAEAKAAIESDLAARGIDKNQGDAYWGKVLQDWQTENLILPATKAASSGVLRDNNWLFFGLSIGLGILGALLYILPKSRRLPGIKNNHIYHSPNHNRGWIAIVIGIWLIAFYLILYFFPQHMVNWIILVDPISEMIKGSPASQWFLYGFLYTLAILVMGVRMLIKYRHNRYQLIRTGSVMFFQLCFAFLLPEIMQALNQPSMDLKNAWPLNYTFFFDYNLDKLTSSGSFGLFLLFWGIVLSFMLVPILTYFYGKRWYCSWVCGCGGLAETLGDPYRQLSDKTTPAWQIERILVHSVLVFAIVMTAIVLYSYFGGTVKIMVNRALLVGVFALLVGGLVWYHRYRNPNIPNRKIYTTAGIFIVAVGIWQLISYQQSNELITTYNHYDVRGIYGFAISSIFAGVVGTGFYPFMGNRVWCRFGCPLAAYLGIVQRFKSRFRITVNGSQCISCGNCSTYCEMGIDVRAYAQRGQNVVRASCVGCGICAAVCPRGVLRLENSSSDVNSRTEELRTLHITDGGVQVIN